MQKQNENSKKINISTSGRTLVKNQHSPSPKYFLGLIALGLLIYTSLRAARLSMTCDEASTYFSHVPNSIFNCFFSNECWMDANNHLLNTFLMQVSVGAFGVSELSLRLPNLFGHFLFLIFSVLLIQRTSKNIWIALGGFCLLNFNPFLLEFFSLARGYGLGAGMMMGSIYFFVRWLDEEKMSLGIYCYVGAFLAVMSNFVFLNYWASLSGLYVFFLLEKINWRKSNLFQKSFFQKISIPITATLVLFFLTKTAIHHLSSKNEFVYGTESFWDSFTGLIRVSLQRQGYFEPFTGNVFILLSLILLGFSVGFGFYHYFLKKKNSFSKLHFASVGLMVLMLVGMVVQYYLLDIKYLDGRKATMLLPIFGLVGYVFLEFLFREKKRKFAVGLAIVFFVFSLNHFYRTSDLKETVEWNYDAETKNMISYLNLKLSEKQKTKLGVYWTIEPASHFYQEQFLMENKIQLSRIREEDFAKLDLFDYVYVEKKHQDLIPSGYVLEKEFGNIGVLFRKTTLRVVPPQLH